MATKNVFGTNGCQAIDTMNESAIDETDLLQLPRCAEIDTSRLLKITLPLLVFHGGRTILVDDAALPL